MGKFYSYLTKESCYTFQFFVVVFFLFCFCITIVVFATVTFFSPLLHKNWIYWIYTCLIKRLSHLSCWSLHLSQSYHGPVGWFSDKSSPHPVCKFRWTDVTYTLSIFIKWIKQHLMRCLKLELLLYNIVLTLPLSLVLSEDYWLCCILFRDIRIKQLNINEGHIFQIYHFAIMLYFVLFYFKKWLLPVFWLISSLPGSDW